MGTSYESFYDGGASSLSPDYGNFTGYRMNGAGQLGFPGSPQTANQVQETVNAIKQGTKVFEVTMLQPDVAETIPKQHFNEMRAIMKLTGVKPSLHGPLIDPAGFGERVWGGDEIRADNERRMFDAVEKAKLLDPKGNIPVVFHASNGAPGSEWRPGGEGEDKFIMQSGSIINKETGQIQGIKREEKWRPGSFYDEDNGKSEKKPTPVLFDAESSVEAANYSNWEEKLTKIAEMNEHAQDIIGSAPIALREKYGSNVFIDEPNKKIFKINENNKREDLGWFDDKQEEMAYQKLRKSSLFLENAELAFNTAFGQAYEYGSDKQKKMLAEIAKSYSKNLSATRGRIMNPSIRRQLLDEAVQNLQEITKRRGIEKDGKIILDKNFGTPKVFDMTENFAMDKAAETFGNLAMKSYDKFKNKAPVIAIENMYQGMAFSRAEDMKKLVEKSRKNFVRKLVDEGKSEKEAEKIAKKHLGVTWDVGHLNIMRKTGFTEKDVVEQTKLINKDKSMVKHIHLTDNFGYADTHLVPGMGNVPIKEILEELEKNGRFDEMRKITEAGGFVQHFKRLPHSMVLGAFDSPVYGMKAAPYWNQAINLQGSYFGGYGTLNPSQHHSMYGAGFTSMPVELGGQMPGGQSRFGRAPMA